LNNSLIIDLKMLFEECEKTANILFY